MTTLVRRIVSGKKRRFQEDGFDLDLSFITENLIAMGFPSEGAEAAFRNKMSDVKRFLETRYGENYRVWNLCSERDYDSSHFGGRVERFGFTDHTPPSLSLVMSACASIHAWLAASVRHVAAVHCKAGKGRTGVMICSYLMFSGRCANALDALALFNAKRTTDGKGVTIPSQIRYIGYFERVLGFPGRKIPEHRQLRMTSLRMHTAPTFDVGGGCDPYCVVESQAIARFRGQYVPYSKFKEKNWTDLDLPADGVAVEGDATITVFDWDRGTQDDKMFWISFNTAFVPQDGYMLLCRTDVDGAAKDKSGRFKEDFCVEVCFGNCRPKKQI